jgi:hypothetical protein
MSSNIQPNDLVVLIFIAGVKYNGLKVGMVGTVIDRDYNVWSPSGARYWEVSFPIGIGSCTERSLRKIDPDGRQVGRWDYCVFNAPKWARDLERARAE